MNFLTYLQAAIEAAKTMEEIQRVDRLLKSGKSEDVSMNDA